MLCEGSLHLGLRGWRILLRRAVMSLQIELRDKEPNGHTIPAVRKSRGSFANPGGGILADSQLTHSNSRKVATNGSSPSIAIFLRPPIYWDSLPLYIGSLMTRAPARLLEDQAVRIMSIVCLPSCSPLGANLGPQLQGVGLASTNTERSNNPN
ncbi:hypothetical protein BO78DRAFT_171949 [Aspergillus sclerotiicarbonarius CBS 121057]|uniref:Uncharacterized protein n=1 Tax=Aspergillus sclerotiicarbonarius (strain CBS 121057 / IBT 28362) TaxID=1448318 RepID=A0A319FDG8_ASPSB|nr:hypothetical protein BO78DRAFT_171949 [Aspergillus sclerotiicarbonarius CBS 121057]